VYPEGSGVKKRATRPASTVRIPRRKH
jgi:hypothetical protein